MINTAYDPYPKPSVALEEVEHFDEAHWHAVYAKITGFDSV